MFYLYLQLDVRFKRTQSNFYLNCYVDDDGDGGGGGGDDDDDGDGGGGGDDDDASLLVVLPYGCDFAFMYRQGLLYFFVTCKQTYYY